MAYRDKEYIYISEKQGEYGKRSYRLVENLDHELRNNKSIKVAMVELRPSYEKALLHNPQGNRSAILATIIDMEKARAVTKNREFKRLDSGVYVLAPKGE